MKQLVLIILLFNLSCKSQNKNISGNNCIGKLKTELTENWKFNSDTNYYKTNFNFLSRFDSTYKFCLYDLPKDNIIELFGKPTIDGKENFQYLASKPCKLQRKNLSNTECTYIRFFVGESKNIVKADVYLLFGTTQQ
jgi:hypothetical protein